MKISTLNPKILNKIVSLGLQNKDFQSEGFIVPFILINVKESKSWVKKVKL